MSCFKRSQLAGSDPKVAVLVVVLVVVDMGREGGGCQEGLIGGKEEFRERV